MIKITKQQLLRLGACEDGIKWFTKHRISRLKNLIPALLKDGHQDYAVWLLVRLLTHSQQIQWAINSAELVVKIFNKTYPYDKRPILAIQAAEDYLTGKISADAACAVANAANAAACAATNAAIKVADADYAAACAAANAANAAYAAIKVADAACAVANAANAAACAAAKAAPTSESKIYGYALILLGE